MKKLLTSLCLLTFFVGFSQSNHEIANVYFKQAEEQYQSFKIQEAANTFQKGLSYIDSLQTPKQARLGFLINYEGKRFDSAKRFAKKYFSIAYDKNSQEYQDALMIFVKMQDEIQEVQEQKRKEFEAKLAKERELRRIDSLKKEWHKLSETFLVSAENIGKFNKNNLALYKSKGKYGVIDDTGKKVILANEYTYAVSNDGYFMFFDSKEKPTKIYCYNTNTNQGFTLPEVSEFHRESTNYGKVMLPRANGRLVTYPNNSLQTLVFDIEAKKFVRIGNLKELLKGLKKSDKIDKFDDDERTVKINKEWYSFGSHLGGGVYSLYNTEEGSIYGFLVTNKESDDPVVVTNIDYLGPYYNDKMQALKEGDAFWVNDNLGESSPAKDEARGYSGDTKIEKQPDGRYKFINSGTVILGDKKLEKLSDYMRKHGKK